MSVDEWSARWKKNESLQECLQCGGKSTREHHWMQVRRWDVAQPQNGATHSSLELLV
jgi:hypothetical protein